MKALVTLTLLLCLGVSGCSQDKAPATLPALPIPAGQVIAKLTDAGFSCELNDADQPFFACRDSGMSAEPLTPFISVDLSTGIDVANAETCFGGATATLDKYPGLAYPIVLAKNFQAAWVPSNDQIGDAKATPAILKQAQAPMAHLGEVVGLPPTSVAAACGIS